MMAVRGKSMSVNARNYTIKSMKMLFPLIASVIICLLQQGVGQDVNSLSVCVNLEGNSLLVEWQPPFPDNLDTLDVHSSSLNDSFSNSFTVRLSSEILNSIAVQVPIHAGGVHLGYIYIVQVTLRTTDGIQIHSDPITVVANYFQDIYWLFKSNSSITFHCALSTTCSRVIGGCMVSLIRQADGQFVNQTIPVVGRKDTVEGSFSNLNFSEPYFFTATAVRRDLMTPLGRAVSGIIPALTFNDISDNANISRNATSSVPTATSKAPITSLLPTIASPSLKSSSLSATSSVSITGSVSSISGRSTSLTSSGNVQSSSSVSIIQSTISIIQSTMSTTIKESKLFTAVTTGSMAIMTTRATTTIIDGLTTITIPPTNTLSSTNIRENNGLESSNPLSTIEIVAFVITLVVLIILIILVLIIIKIYLLKKTRQTQQPPVIRLSTVNNIIAADINLKSNPTDIKVKGIPTRAKIANNPVAVKNESNLEENIELQRNPAYQKYNADDYYY